MVLPLSTASRAFAQSELAGSWAARNTEDISRDSYPVDYLGLPLNDEGRTRALSLQRIAAGDDRAAVRRMAGLLFRAGSVRAEDLERHGADQGRHVSWTIGAWEDRAPMTIWMDGRPHPSAHAEHTRGGFTTGRWEGTTLVAHTTHMKAGFIRKNGPPSSDQATMTSRFFRHGDILTVLVVIDDPIYLAEPQIISKSFQLSAAPISPVGPPCVSGFEGRPPGESVPHYLPEKNPFVDELTKLFGLPREAVLGGAETLYPEYRKKIKEHVRAPRAVQERLRGGSGSITRMPNAQCPVPKLNIGTLECRRLS